MVNAQTDEIDANNFSENPNKVSKEVSAQVKTTAKPTMQKWQVDVLNLPEGYDWVLLKNGELFKGEVVSMYQNSIEFDSDEVGLINLDFDDIDQLRGTQIMSIRFDNDEVVEGKIYIHEGIITFLDKPELQFPQDTVLAVARSKESGESLWDGSASFGVNYRSGNTEKFDYSGQIKLRRLTSTSRVLINTASNYSEVKDAETDENVRTVKNTRVTASYDWFYSRKVFFRVPGFSYYTDEFKNIKHQVGLGVAAGYVIYDEAHLNWDFHVGPSVLYTEYEQVEVDQDDTQSSPVIEVGTRYNYDLTKDIEFFLEYTVKFVNEESGSQLHHLEGGFDIELISDFDLNLKSIIDRVEKPIPDTEGIYPEKDDVLFIVSIKYSF
ncbi:YdiY family protein [Thalassomonas sp. M1454]|uniref:DUF481 domain-containing protein n=1 Tax=Thalassomonas sp. M1454 TaxID=2594477 RepID=UPI00163DD4C1|nr:DUF481 domain-containing protein [Thalassomonas sp. M1454]